MKERIANNIQKMRKALENVLNALKKAYAKVEVDRVWLADNIDIIIAALTAPPRNCDVGDEKTQYIRFCRYCKQIKDGACSPTFCKNCLHSWLLEPYKEEV